MVNCKQPSYESLFDRKSKKSLNLCQHHYDEKADEANRTLLARVRTTAKPQPTTEQTNDNDDDLYFQDVEEEEEVPIVRKPRERVAPYSAQHLKLAIKVRLCLLNSIRNAGSSLRKRRRDEDGVDDDVTNTSEYLKAEVGEYSSVYKPIVLDLLDLFDVTVDTAYTSISDTPSVMKFLDEFCLQLKAKYLSSSSSSLPSYSDFLSQYKFD